MLASLSRPNRSSPRRAGVGSMVSFSPPEPRAPLHLPTHARTMFTHEAVAAWNARLERRATRVTAYTMGGTQVCLPGLDAFTFPGQWTVQQALNSGEWVRRATQEELREDSRWWRVLSFTPRAIVHSNGQPALSTDRLDLVGTQITILEQPVEVRPVTETRPWSP